MRLALFLFVPLIAAAEQCPWLSEATAGGSLVSVKPTSCVFARKDGASLTVEVQTLKSPKEFLGCNGQPLTGIGNEASECGDSVAGRVRNQAFTIRIVPARPEKARKIAELVAGFLF